VPVFDGVDFQFPPVNRHRLARYLELPSIAELDDTTDAEIRKLDERRGELLSMWRRAVTVPIEGIDGAWITLGEDGTRIQATTTYGRRLVESGADAVVIAALTVGARVDEEIKGHLDREEIYEAFVLKQWAATMTEQARVAVTNRVRRWAQSVDRSLLPYDGPGYNDWPLSALDPLLEMLYAAGELDVARPIRATEHGVLLPTNSMLIVYGLTPNAAAVERPDGLAQCHRCAMRNCRYRMTAAAEAAC